jgi:hypothetical protein
VLVIGGAYEERCEQPLWNAVFGSGLRAAAALAGVDPGVRLLTAWQGGDTAVVGSVMASHGATGTPEIVARDQAVGFSYFTPLAPPSIEGRQVRALAPLNGEEDVVVLFGMIETRASCRARRLVVDPQAPRELGNDLWWSDSAADETAVVANRAETMRLGDASDVPTAARQLLVRSGAVAVVTKLAARGLLVTTADMQTHVGAYPTDRVFPIGSGDVFAGAFAYGWGQLGLSPVDAARLASGATATYCGTQFLPLTPSGVRGPRTDAETSDAARRIYLAAPFFTLSQRWLVELVRSVLPDVGADVFSPLHDVGVGGDEVAKPDLEGLEGCSAVLALLDEIDVGTSVEIGWAAAKGIPVVGYSSRPADDAWKMVRGTGGTVVDDLSTAVYRAVWATP